MQPPLLLSLICLAILAPSSVWTADEQGVRRRQGLFDSDLPSLTSVVQAASTSNNPSSDTTTNSQPSSSATPTSSPTTSTTNHLSSSGSVFSTLTANVTSSHANSTSSSAVLATSTSSTSSSNSTSSSENNNSAVLPLQPAITPALSVAGVILIISGAIYALIGVKNKWVQIFLSTGYLTSLSITVLIDYVMNPPVSNAIQGAYFVGIFMTGVIFGGGALIFKEVTEGLGCLYGGFCLSMWFLTLKSGGLITSSVGKGIFVAAFCVITWSLSFSHYTRSYGLIGSKSFGGATAFIIGIDCFSQAGLKEFWFYVWDLNDNLFPLNTSTYPITRGIRVETVIILLGCAIGIMSQIKLWKVVRDQQRKRDADREEDDRRRNVVEEAIGRHLQRHNDRDRSQWEKQYGNRLSAKRSTVLWSDAHPDKHASQIINTEIKPASHESSSFDESLAMTPLGASKVLSAQDSKAKRTSSATVGAVPEELEEAKKRTSVERQRRKTLAALENPSSTFSKDGASDGSQNSVDDAIPVPSIPPLPFKIPASEHGSQSDHEPTVREKSMGRGGITAKAIKRQSLRSAFSDSPRRSLERASSESQEALVMPEFNHSRASSVAATFDEENEHLSRVPSHDTLTPQIVISPVASRETLKGDERKLNIRDLAPSPPVLPDSDDPEELNRPLSIIRHEQMLQSANSNAKVNDKVKETGTATEAEPEADVAGNVRALSDRPSYTSSTSEQALNNEGLTKGALAQVPSQLSNVVLSYRTNEWAKHISVADAPMFDEPHSIEDNVHEAPVQLAPPSPPLVVSPKNETLTESTHPTTATFKSPLPRGSLVVSGQPLQRSVSDQQVPSLTSLSTFAPSSAQLKALDNKRKRSSLTGINIKQSLVATTIDENEPTEFATISEQKRRSTIGTIGTSNRIENTISLITPNTNALDGVRPTTSYEPQTNMMQPNSMIYNQMSMSGIRPTTSYEAQNNVIKPNSMIYNQMSMNAMSRLSLVDNNQQVISRPSSAMSSNRPMLLENRSLSALSNYPGMRLEARSPSPFGNYPAMRSETRLDSYESRQPQKRNDEMENHRRETLMTEWRMSQQQGVTKSVVPQMNVETRRAQMLLDREHKKLMEDQNRAIQQQKQTAIDQVMRRADMQGLHREAMRRMQANANKNI